MYAKLFTSIYQGTLRGNSHGLLVFTNLIAHCDKDGIVDMHPRAIAEEVGLSVDQVKAALLELEAPDDESRSPEEQGRRIVRLDEHRAWGWKVVNYVKYRAIRNEDDRREQNRQSQARWREKNKPQSAAVSRDKPPSAHTEAEAEAYSEAENTHTGVSEAARVCVLLRQNGIQNVNPGHPDLLALINAGAHDEEFVGAAAYAAEKGKGFAYVLGTLKRQREDAAKLNLQRGPVEAPRARAARERVAAFAPGAAAKAPSTAEVIDVTARRLG